MKIYIRFILIITLTILLSACNDEKNNADNLEFYILRHVEGSNEFVKDDKPIFTGEDILSYDWDSHTIIFMEDFLSSRRYDEIEEDIIIGGSQLLGVFYPDQFAIYLDGEELYRGYLQPQAFVSFIPGGPIISDSEKGIIINNTSIESDARNNKKLYEFLEDNDLLL